MRTLLVFLALACGVLAFPLHGHADIYKWVDKNGVVTFRDTPPPEGVNAEKRETRSLPVPESAAPNPAAAPDPTGKTAPAAAPAAKKDYPPVEIYMAKWCPACKSAIKYLDSLGVPYTKYDVDEDKAASDRLHNSYQQRSIPLTIIGDQRIIGFSQQRFDAALGIGR